MVNTRINRNVNLNRKRLGYLVRQGLRKIGFHIEYEGWYKIRHKALRRDNYTCQNPSCGFKSRRKNTVHHINHNTEDNRIENLITYCRPCHDKIDANTDLLEKTAQEEKT